MKSHVAILDYGCGNLRSVYNAVREVGGEPLILREGDVSKDATHIIMPGQGHFGVAAESLRYFHWGEPRKPVLGICLGMQLMCEGSEEAPGVKGLGWFPLKVERMRIKRLPYVGWDRVWYRRLDCFEGDLRRLRPATDFYFCNSYGINKREVYALWTKKEWFDFGTVDRSIEQPPTAQEYIAEIRQHNLWAVQFHPEKSGKAGLAFLREFLSL